MSVKGSLQFWELGTHPSWWCVGFHRWHHCFTGKIGWEVWWGNLELTWYPYDRAAYRDVHPSVRHGGRDEHNKTA